MLRIIRYQGAIIRGHEVLLIQHRSHATGEADWLLPGGGIEEDETEEECVAREMQEETGVTVRVERLLMDHPTNNRRGYKRRKTYLCTIVSGEPAPGYEPEPDARAIYSIVAVKWFDLRNPAAWDQWLGDDRLTRGQLHQMRAALGLA